MTGALPPRAGDYQLNPERAVEAIDMIRRTGATEVEFGFLDEDVPVHLARWWARARWKGATLIEEEHRGPIEALEALVRVATRGALCRRCGRRIHWGAPSRRITLSGNVCGWRRVVGRWEPGCPA